MRDTEQAYRDFTLDVFETDDGWQVDWWSRANPGVCGRIVARRRKEAISRAKEEILQTLPDAVVENMLRNSADDHSNFGIY